MKDIIAPLHSTALLLFENGEVVFGKGHGYQGIYCGEICFNTAMTGYQEIMTDPSYRDQIITFTFPHIGNTGINNQDYESKQVYAKSIILRNDIAEYSNYRANESLEDFLLMHNISAISGIDTRALVQKLRSLGTSNVLIYHFGNDISNIKLDELLDHLHNTSKMEGKELALKSSCHESFEWGDGFWNQKHNSYDTDIHAKYPRRCGRLWCKI